MTWMIIVAAVLTPCLCVVAVAVAADQWRSGRRLARVTVRRERQSQIIVTLAEQATQRLEERRGQES